MNRINKIVFLVALLPGCVGSTTPPLPEYQPLPLPTLGPTDKEEKTDTKPLPKPNSAPFLMARKPNAQEMAQFVIVHPGDTLGTLAITHRIPIEHLAEWNNITEQNRLLIGKRLRITPWFLAPPPPTTQEEDASEKRLAVPP
ncbi:MAG: LysM peptidoglycan-binding domain-containing protein, partial [Magnetococcales bacterium]|nr:LysM peptidoglycan-binding domain-containing protein [Magnetococcales bacterium]